MTTPADYERAKEMRAALAALGLAPPIVAQLRETHPSDAIPLMQQLLDAAPGTIGRLSKAAQTMEQALTSGDRLTVTYDGETYTRTVEHVSDPDEDGAVTLTFEKLV